MRKEGRNLAFAIAALLCMSVVASAEMLDESQTDISQAYSFLAGEAKAQSFRIDDGKWLYQVDFYYSPGDCAILKAWIDTDTNGSNGNLTYYTFDTTSWTAGWHTWNIRSTHGDIQLNPGTTYYIILMPGVFSTNPAWYGSTSDVYANGRAWHTNESGWQPLDTVDYSFKIYTDVDPVANYTYTTDALTLYVDASSSYTPDGDPISSYEWDWDGDNIYDDTGITANHTYDIGGTYTVKLKITDEDGHVDTETKNIMITANQAPTASFDYTVKGMTVTVDASDSQDPDGSIVLYEWDWESDGIFDENHTTPTASHTYESVGNYTITLRVTDNDGATDTVTSADGGGWIIIDKDEVWKLPFSWFEMILMAMIGLVGIATSAFFLKPESIKHVGYAPAAGSLLITVFIIAAFLLYHAGMEWYWIAADIALIIFLLYVVLKVVASKKKKVVKTIFGR